MKFWKIFSLAILTSGWIVLQIVQSQRIHDLQERAYDLEKQVIECVSDANTVNTDRIEQIRISFMYGWFKGSNATADLISRNRLTTFNRNHAFKNDSTMFDNDIEIVKK